MPRRTRLRGRNHPKGKKRPKSWHRRDAHRRWQRAVRLFRRNGVRP